MQVRHILLGKGRDVVAIASNATLCDAAKLLTDRGIGALVVMDGNGALTGIISERNPKTPRSTGTGAIPSVPTPTA